MNGIVRGGFCILLVLFALGAAVPAVAASEESASDAEPVDVLILPPWYISSRSVVADFAEYKLADAAREVLQADPRFLVVDQPALNAREAAIVLEHLKLFLLVAMSIEDAKRAGRLWLDTRREADHRLGEGLSFLADQTGARYGFIITCSETPPSGLYAAPVPVTSPFPVATAFNPFPSSGLFFAMVELSTGRIVWYGDRHRFDGNKMLLGSPDALRDVIAAVVSSYPRSSGLSFADRSVPEARP